MPVDRPDMHSPQVDKPSPPRSVHDFEDEWLAGLQHASKSLVEAVFQSDYDEVGAILENERVEVDEKGPAGRTALSFAIEENKYEIVELLLTRGADPNTREDENRTPFFWAAPRRRRQPNFWYRGMIETLLRAGANPSLTDDRGDTPLAVAAATGNEEFLTQVLSMASAADIGIDIDINLEIKNADGYTALSLAAGSGYDAIIKLLVESGRAAINTQGDEERAPLICAAAGGWPKCVRYLLSHGADMGSCTWWERFLQTRSRQRKEATPPQSEKSDLEDIMFWLQNSSFGNQVLPNGRTFLSWAVEYEDEELDLKADPDTRDTTEHQMTPLIRALKIGSMAMVRLLEKKDRYSMHILVDEADGMGEEQALDLARKLLGRGYDLTKLDFKGQNPVHIACHKGRKQFVEEFLHPNYEKNCEKDLIHSQDNNGKTPLQYAIDDEDIFRLLVEAGAYLSYVPSTTLFELRKPNPLCVQLTRNLRAPDQTKKMRLRLISDYAEAHELWKPQSGETQLR